jgi:dTDP-4-amino-4,6-dideoxy-D-galactose acyltransferase
LEGSENSITLSPLDWDTKFFGVLSAKATLHTSVSQNQWEKLKIEFKKYQFLSILNENSNPENTQLIGRDTHAFLADINVQFEKNITTMSSVVPLNITIENCLKPNEQVLKLAHFEYSRFLEDPELAKRGGSKLYLKWIMSCFEEKEKYFALSTNNNGDVNGFVLFSFTDLVCKIELIATSKGEKKGIGTSLFKAVEDKSYKKGVNLIQVGTQIRNKQAMNFYHKVGCRQVGCHQIYHLWNL